MEIINGLKDLMPNKIDVLVPESSNRYIQHIWEHTVLPKKASNYRVLFCPANVCPVYKPKNTKFVTTVHDLSFLYYPESFSKSYRVYYKAVTPRILDLSDIIITVSNYEKSMISLLYPLIKQKINVIYSGVDEVFFEDKKEKKEDYLLYVGNLSERKNFVGLLKAFERIYKEIDKKLVVVGMKPDIMKLGKDVKNILKVIPKEYIDFKGQINDKQVLSKIYKKALAFVFPSFYESFGFPPLEAMASGTPVIVSSRSALPEICGDAVIYVDAENSDSIAEGIVKVVKNKNLRNNLIEKGKEHVKAFRWYKTIKKHKELLKELL